MKGSYEVIRRFEALIDEWNVAGVVELKGVFCLGHCTEAVTVQIGDDIFTAVNGETAETIFRSEVLPRLGVN